MIFRRKNQNPPPTRTSRKSRSSERRRPLRAYSPSWSPPNWRLRDHSPYWTAVSVVCIERGLRRRSTTPAREIVSRSWAWYWRESRNRLLASPTANSWRSEHGTRPQCSYRRFDSAHARIRDRSLGERLLSFFTIGTSSLWIETRYSVLVPLNTVFMKICIFFSPSNL